MPSKEKETRAAAKKPFKVLTLRATIGWLAAIFVVCGWMFALGVLVGRDQAPIKYDLNAIEKKLSKLKQRESVTGGGGADKKTGAPKDKNQLDFYEALPENREDTKIPKAPKPKAESQKSSPPAEGVKPPQTPPDNQRAEGKSTSEDLSGTSSQPRVSDNSSGPGIYTIQASSVKNLPDADRMVSKLKKRGYPAFRLTSQVEGKGTWHRVRIGSYASKEEATQVLNELRQAGMKPILVKTK